MYMKFLMTLFIFAACSTAVQSTHRVKTRNCKYFIKATFDRMIAEMTDIKEDITSLKAENSALQREVSDQQEEFNGLKMENTELKMKVIDLEQNNNQSVDGHWTGWLQWSGCTDIGESGQMTRERLCLNPRPSNGGNDCAGPITEQMECELSSGVVDGHWTGWLQWSGCTDIGGSGLMTRERLCLNPRPSNGGSDCAGPDTEQRECELSSDEDPVRSAFAIGGVTLTEDTMTGVAIFPTYRINIGGDYNTSTGQFTCEIPGTYVFSFNLVKTSAATSSVYCYFRKNGGYQGYAAVPATTGFHESSVSLILSLGENDTVDVGDCGNVDDISSVTSFTGFLLYPV